MILHRPLCWLLAAAAAAGTAAPPLSAQQWTRFRGPNGSGAVEGVTLPAQWSQREYLWQVALPGVGHSSPVAWNGKVFLTSADPRTAERYLLCIDAATGQLAWRRNDPGRPSHLHARNSFASSTPVVDERLVYAVWGAPEQVTVLALDHAGRPVWQRDLGPFVSMHGFGTSPMLYEDLLILSNQQEGEQLDGRAPGQSSVLALNRASGAVRWQTPRQSSVAPYCVPCVYRGPDGRDQLICCSTAHGMFSLDPRNGRENWAAPVFTMRTVSSPLVVGELILGTTGSGGGGNYLVAVRPGPEPDVAYVVRTQAPYVPTPVASGDLIFLWSDQGIVTCIDAAEGRVHWRERIGGNYSGSPVRVGQRIGCISEEGEVVVLAAAREFQLLGRTALGEPSRSTPAIADGRIYLRTESRLFCLKALP